MYACMGVYVGVCKCYACMCMGGIFVINTLLFLLKIHSVLITFIRKINLIRISK